MTMSPIHRLLLAAVLTAGPGAGVSPGQDNEMARLRAENAQLRQRTKVLQEAVTEANRSEEESARALAQIKLRLEAIGKDLLDGGDDRTVSAVADRMVAVRQLEKLEQAAMRLSASVQSYLKTAIAADPEARADVEAKLRELEVELELRQRPEPNVERGSLQHAKVKSIDAESGLVVLNVGANEDARIGMLFEIMRGDELIAEAMVAETRPDCCGVFVQRLEKEDNPVRFNDTASVKKH